MDLPLTLIMAQVIAIRPLLLEHKGNLPDSVVSELKKGFPFMTDSFIDDERCCYIDWAQYAQE